MKVPLLSLIGATVTASSVEGSSPVSPFGVSPTYLDGALSLFCQSGQLEIRSASSEELRGISKAFASKKADKISCAIKKAGVQPENELENKKEIALAVSKASTDAAADSIIPGTSVVAEGITAEDRAEEEEKEAKHPLVILLKVMSKETKLDPVYRMAVLWMLAANIIPTSSKLGADSSPLRIADQVPEWPGLSGLIFTAFSSQTGGVLEEGALTKLDASENAPTKLKKSVASMIEEMEWARDHFDQDDLRGQAMALIEHAAFISSLPEEELNEMDEYSAENIALAMAKKEQEQLRKAEEELENATKRHMREAERISEREKLRQAKNEERKKEKEDKILYRAQRRSDRAHKVQAASNQRKQLAIERAEEKARMEAEKKLKEENEKKDGKQDDKDTAFVEGTFSKDENEEKAEDEEPDATPAEGQESEPAVDDDEGTTAAQTIEELESPDDVTQEDIDKLNFPDCAVVATVKPDLFLPSPRDTAQLMRERMASFAASTEQSYTFVSRIIRDAAEFIRSGSRIHDVQALSAHMRKQVLPSLCGRSSAEAGSCMRDTSSCGYQVIKAVRSGRTEEIACALLKQPNMLDSGPSGVGFQESRSGESPLHAAVHKLNEAVSAEDILTMMTNLLLVVGAGFRASLVDVDVKNPLQYLYDEAFDGPGTDNVASDVEGRPTGSFPKKKKKSKKGKKSSFIEEQAQVVRESPPSFLASALETADNLLEQTLEVKANLSYVQKHVQSSLSSAASFLGSSSLMHMMDGVSAFIHSSEASAESITDEPSNDEPALGPRTLPEETPTPKDITHEDAKAICGAALAMAGATVPDLSAATGIPKNILYKRVLEASSKLLFSADDLESKMLASAIPIVAASMSTEDATYQAKAQVDRCRSSQKVAAFTLVKELEKARKAMKEAKKAGEEVKKSTEEVKKSTEEVKKSNEEVKKHQEEEQAMQEDRMKKLEEENDKAYEKEYEQMERAKKQREKYIEDLKDK